MLSAQNSNESVLIHTTNLSDKRKAGLLARLLQKSLQHKTFHLLKGQTYSIELNDKRINIELDASILIRKSKHSGYRFEVFGEELGAGHFGTVYKSVATLKITRQGQCIVKQKLAYQQRVIKVQEITGDPDYCVKSHINEAEYSARASYLHAKDLVVGDQATYLVTRYFEKYPFDVNLLTIEQRCFMTRQLLLALQAFHDSDLVHRDIKPDNIIFDKNLNAKIIDLGFCTDKNSGCERLVGTPMFVTFDALDVGVDGLANKPARDIFAMGLVISTIWLAKIAEPTSSEMIDAGGLLPAMLQINANPPLMGLFQGITLTELSQSIRDRLRMFIYKMTDGESGNRIGNDEALRSFDDIQLDVFLRQHPEIDAQKMRHSHLLGIMAMHDLRQINEARKLAGEFRAKDFDRIKNAVLSRLKDVDESNEVYLNCFFDKVGMLEMCAGCSKKEVQEMMTEMVCYFKKSIMKIDRLKAQCDKILDALYANDSLASILPGQLCESVDERCDDLLDELNRFHLTFERLDDLGRLFHKEMPAIEAMLPEINQGLVALRQGAVARASFGLFATVEYNKLVRPVSREVKMEEMAISMGHLLI